MPFVSGNEPRAWAISFVYVRVGLRNRLWEPGARSWLSSESLTNYHLMQSGAIRTRSSATYWCDLLMLLIWSNNWMNCWMNCWIYCWCDQTAELVKEAHWWPSTGSCIIVCDATSRYSSDQFQAPSTSWRATSPLQREQPQFLNEPFFRIFYYISLLARNFEVRSFFSTEPFSFSKTFQETACRDSNSLMWQSLKRARGF